MKPQKGKPKAKEEPKPKAKVEDPKPKDKKVEEAKPKEKEESKPQWKKRKWDNATIYYAHTSNIVLHLLKFTSSLKYIWCAIAILTLLRKASS